MRVAFGITPYGALCGIGNCLWDFQQSRGDGPEFKSWHRQSCLCVYVRAARESAQAGLPVPLFMRMRNARCGTMRVPMAAAANNPTTFTTGAPRETRNDTLILAAIAAAVALIHIATNGRYGFHRDELQTMTDAWHMEWGFVAYPPFTPAIERISWALFGPSLTGLRLFSVIAQALAIFITGLMARELGGRRLAQVTA